MITEPYREQLVKLHGSKNWGNQGWKALPEVTSLILQYQIKNPTVLDFGCGTGSLERDAKWAMPHVYVRSYDPGRLQFSPVPDGVFDIVVCTDVMEHVEPEYVSATLNLLRKSTRYATIFTIATAKSKVCLPDGRNSHLTIKPASWWHAELQARWKTLEPIKGKGLALVARV